MTPTQAQIEAAAKAAYEANYNDFPWERALDEDKETYCIIATAALTAAAEVGEPTLRTLIDRADMSATIERCVQRIYQFTDLSDTQKENIAAAIRALKDS